MSYYLVDFENVRTDGVKNLVDLKEGDTVAIFYSEQCKNISLDVIDNLTRLNVHISCYKAKIGTKNALDFQLSSYLGYIIGRGGTKIEEGIIPIHIDDDTSSLSAIDLFVRGYRK